MLNFCREETLFSFLHEAMYSYKETQESPYAPLKLAVHSILCPENDPLSNCGHNFKKTVPFDDMVQFIDEEKIVTHAIFDCSMTFYPEAPTKIGQINRERNFFSRSCVISKCIPSQYEQFCSIVEQHTSIIFLNPYNLWDVDPVTFMTLNHTTEKDSLSNQYPQTTPHQPRPDYCFCP